MTALAGASRQGIFDQNIHFLEVSFQCYMRLVCESAEEMEVLTHEY